MQLSSKAQEVLQALDHDDPKMGDVKKIAAEIKKNHSLALELWATKAFGARLLSLLIMDKMLLTQETIDSLAGDMADHEDDQRDKLSEWLLAHQLMKSKKTTALIEGWADHPSTVLRRLFWYYQGRLRWMGKVPVDNAASLLQAINQSMANEAPDVQWAMNFTAGWIGVHQPEYRDECIKLGESLGLYKGDPVSRGCTPSYLPEFIAVEVSKLV